MSKRCTGYEWWMNSWKGFGKEAVCPNGSYYPYICKEGSDVTTKKKFSHDMKCGRSDWKKGHPQHTSQVLHCLSQFNDVKIMLGVTVSALL